MKINYSVGKAGIVSLLLIALTGCTTYVVQRPEPQTEYTPPPPPQPVPEYVQPAPPPPTPVYVQQAPPPAPTVVVIQREDDFYQPLSPYGEWVVVGSYGRVWRPRQVEAGWRPYSNGHWEWTDDGWYWASDEPWAWATYHYGRWEMAGNDGWIWVPQTQWAPAWVDWREGGGYVGWAPMPPERRGGVSVNVTVAPAAFCFVEESRMHEPVRSKTVIVNNTTIINKTVNITKTKVVNKVVINEGPRSDEVERVTGRKIQKVSVNELRHKEEEPVAEKNRNLQQRPENRLLQPLPKQPEPPKEIRAQEPPKPERAIPTATKNHQDEIVKSRQDDAAKNRQEEAARNRQEEVLKNHQEQVIKNTPPPPAPPAPREVRAVEKPVEKTPPVLKVNDRQPAKPQPKVQSPRQSEQKLLAPKPDKQKAVSPKEKDKNPPKAKNGGREAGGTNTIDNANPRDRR